MLSAFKSPLMSQWAPQQWQDRVQAPGSFDKTVDVAVGPNQTLYTLINSQRLGSGGGMNANLVSYDLSQSDPGRSIRDTVGTPGWSRAKGMAIGERGDVYWGGRKNENPGQAFLIRYDPQSNSRAWTDLIGQQGSASDLIRDVVVRGDRLNAIGTTQGGLGGSSNQGGRDLFVARYDLDPTNTSPTRAWLEQWGTPKRDWLASAALDEQGNLYITGYTEGAPGSASGNDRDAILLRYGATSGIQHALCILETSQADRAFTVETGPDHALYTSGFTKGALSGWLNAGGRDGFVVTWKPVASSPKP